MDIDAETGGYNLHAFSTGYLAGESAAAFVKEIIVRSHGLLSSVSYIQYV